MILHESTETRDRKIHIRTPERLPKLVRISREKISERPKKIYAIEAVRHVGSQSDAIHSSADLPKVFALRARVRIAGLIVIFATFAVSRVGTPEDNQPNYVNLRAKRLVRVQDGMTCGDLEPQIAHSL